MEVSIFVLRVPHVVSLLGGALVKKSLQYAPTFLQLRAMSCEPLQDGTSSTKKSRRKVLVLMHHAWTSSTAPVGFSCVDCSVAADRLLPIQYIERCGRLLEEERRYKEITERSSRPHATCVNILNGALRLLLCGLFNRCRSSTSKAIH
jgi:hypothetical protein